MLKRTLRSDFGEVSIRQSGIVQAKVLVGVEIDLEKAKVYHSLVKLLTRGEKHCTVIDLTGVSGITPEARTYMQESSSAWGRTIAVALISNTFTSRVLANYFLSVNRPSYPVKVFNNGTEALNWANHALTKHNMVSSS